MRQDGFSPSPMKNLGGICCEQMRPSLPPPPVPGNTDWERFDNAVGMVLNAPKQAFVKQEKKLKRRREKKRAARNSD
jgi:hypothetical protein